MIKKIETIKKASKTEARDIKIEQKTFENINEVIEFVNFDKKIKILSIVGNVGITMGFTSSYTLFYVRRK